MDRQSLDRHSLDVLDFPRVRELLAGYCATVPGRELALALEPDTDASRVNLELDRLEEVIAVEEQPALGGVKDIRALLAQARAGSVLTARELLAVRSTGVALRECREFFQRHGARLSAMAGLTGGLGAWPELEAEVGWAIDDSGEIRDAATPELQKIRRELRRRRNDLVGKLEAIIQAGPEWFEGPVAVRGDRFVLPLRQEERSRVAGVVHGASGTGHTLFVEPLQTVAEQNEVQELRDAEAEEQARILRRLTGLVAGSEAGLSAALAAVAAVDLVLAKRRFSGRFGCTRPGISTDGGLELARARHPLLLCRGIDAVPLDFRLPDSTGVVLVSGPNAGGKTVVLKTVGLLSLMAMSGMFVPAGEGTRLPLFERVLADIGDEQSLDRDLSSFTAHLLRLKEFVEQAGSRTLVIIDEIGASTAPEEGAALAMAVLEALRKAGSTCLATTHFGALKLFVQDEPGMTNAAMEFRDGPTYRLLLGTPGESSALDIAERAGLPGWLLARARARLGADWLDLSDKVKALGRELERAERERRQAEAAQQEAGRLRHDYEARLAEFTGWRSAEKTRVSQAGERLVR
ncbi:endonuclease MutS2, partial [candidate division WOR-3 bacterium]|nr:endonuclease MutS2 [candidate division WOR-3 bacterium]